MCGSFPHRASADSTARVAHQGGDREATISGNQDAIEAAEQIIVGIIKDVCVVTLSGVDGRLTAGLIGRGTNARITAASG